ncbi:MAG: hypothetical protein AABY15_07210 [Nanoarchaeota archaeon]
MANDNTIDLSGEFNGTSSTAGVSGDFLRATTTTGTFNISSIGETTIESFEFKETSDGNFIEVVKRQKTSSYFQLAIWPPQEPVDRVFKEIYGVTTNDKGERQLQLIKTIEGKVTPGHYVDESIEFNG